MSKDFLIKVLDSSRNERAVASDANGNIGVTLGTTIAGEDIANDVQKVEERFSPSNIVSAAGTLVKTGAGMLHLIQVNDVGTAWEIDIYDGTTSSGTALAKMRSTTVGDKRFDVTFATGLFIDTVKGTAVGNLTVSYR